MRQEISVIRMAGTAVIALAVIAYATSCSRPAQGTDRAGGVVSKGKPTVIRVSEPGDYRQVIRVGGMDRYYIVHCPPAYESGQPLPVLLGFHGGGGNPQAFAEMTGFNRLSDRSDFIVVYPAGSGNTARRLHWNILLSDTYATAKDIDDLRFVNVLLDDLAAYFYIDPMRIYATGFSQGAMLCYRLACDPDVSTRIAAIAPVGGTMTVASSDCRASGPVPVIHFHGRQDPYSNYAGGIGSKSVRNDRVPRPGVAESIAYWVENNGLAGQNVTRETVGRAVREGYGLDSTAPVVLWTLEDGGHTWPGGTSYLPEFVMGKINRDVDASSRIWAFVSRFRQNNAGGN